MVSIKTGVKLKGLQPEILVGLQVMIDLLKKYGYDTVITEGTGGTHMPESLHYKGLALDLRSKHIVSNTDKKALLIDGKQLLGENYDLILEGTGTPTEHLHLEFDPKE